MADTKISALTDGGAVQNTDQIPVSRSGVNFRVQVGTAAAAATGDFATAAQGTLAGTAVQPGAITGSGLTQATARLLGRSTAGTGAVEEITLGTNLSFTGTTLNAAGGGGGSPAGSSGDYQYNNAGSFGAGNLKHGTNLAELRNGTAAQEFRLYRSFTDVSNLGYTGLRQDATTGFILDSVNLGSVGAPTNLLDVRANGSSRLALRLAGAFSLVAADGSGFYFESSTGTTFGGSPVWRSAAAADGYVVTRGDARSTAYSLGALRFRASSSGGLALLSSGDHYAASVDLMYGRNAAGVGEINDGTAGQFRDLKLRSVIQVPPASITPASNGDLVFEATSNTSITVKFKGSDGTVRTNVLTMA